MRRRDRIFVAGHGGLVGSALVRELSGRGWENILLRTRRELDLADPAAVGAFFAKERPRFVFLAAAKVGGIGANVAFPAAMAYENLAIETSVIHQAKLAGVEKLLFLGSSCCYPRLSPQPIRESALLSGPLEPTNKAYAVAKIAGIALCQAYREQYGCRFFSVMPTNLYGPNDNFDPDTSHVLPAMIRKFHDAKARSRDEVVLWGSGRPRREFLHVDDLARACVQLMEEYDAPEPVNVGTGIDLTVKELAAAVAAAVGFRGRVRWDRSKPEGAPSKRLDVRRLRRMGWRPKIDLETGLQTTYGWFLDNRR